MVGAPANVIAPAVTAAKHNAFRGRVLVRLAYPDVEMICVQHDLARGVLTPLILVHAVGTIWKAKSDGKFDEHIMGSSRLEVGGNCR
jgi:hypothetical protein